MEKTTHLYLVRYGEAMSNAGNTIAKIRLSPLGIRQAEHLRDRLTATGEIRADVLIASTMERARHTAEIIAPALGLPVVLDSEIEERRYGEAENMLVGEYRASYRALPLDQLPFFQVAPDEESRAQFSLRACTALSRIIHTYEGNTIMLVCHGGIIDTSFSFFFEFSTVHIPRALFKTRNTSITHWYKVPFGHVPNTWTLERYNDVMHLHDLDTPERIPWQHLTQQPVKSDNKPDVATEAPPGDEQ